MVVTIQLRVSAIFLALVLSAACGPVGAPPGDVDGRAIEIAAAEVGLNPDIAAVPEWRDERNVQSELVADITLPPQATGCVQCHTDKDRLVALAPPEPPLEEEESGGG